MADHPERRVDAERARQGRTGKGVRYVLGISMLGAIIGLSIVAFTMT